MFDQVRELVECLVDTVGMDYPDLTGYNLMLDNQGRVWIVDFEHARPLSSPGQRLECCAFTRAFLGGTNSWNTELNLEM